MGNLEETQRCQVVIRLADLVEELIDRTTKGWIFIDDE